MTDKNNSLRVSLSRAIFLLRSGKFHEFFSALTRKGKMFATVDEDKQYQKWIGKNELDEAAQSELKQWCAGLDSLPLITFILQNCTDSALIDRTIQSVRHQYSQNWELLISGSDPAVSKIDPDPRIRFVPESELARNVNGGWLAPVSEGDTLAPFALAELLRLLNNESDLDFIYSDHDVIDLNGRRTQPFFKPGWSPEFLSDSPYTARLSLYRAQVIPADSLFWNDEQSWLKYFASRSVHAARIPKVLYHYSSKPEFPSNRQRQRPQNQGSISILISTRDQPTQLKCAVHSIFEKTSYSNFEIVIINNSSVDGETFHSFDELRKEPQIRIIDYPYPFNFSAINNFGVSKTDSEYVVFLNDDTEVITPSWLEAMLCYAQSDQIGAVGAKLLYRDNTIQHAGILIGHPYIAVHAHRGFPRDSEGYTGRLVSVQNFSAVTGACMMVRRQQFLEIGGFDENLPFAYNDVDLCLKLLTAGKRIVWTPHSELYHDESSSRGYEITLDKQKRLDAETNHFLQRWKEILENGDPYYSPNLSLENGAFRILV